ncbi:MAG: hypothetical protein OEW00_00605 [candidate division Zixibacteria bacterium]|nr:hypothetical protein [candidate division Zixibacteria bacterium]
MVDKLTSILSRFFFIVAFLLLLIAVVDWFLRLFGWTFSWLPYQPGRLFEFAAMLMICVVVLLLRQIRESLRHS